MGRIISGLTWPVRRLRNWRNLNYDLESIKREHTRGRHLEYRLDWNRIKRRYLKSEKDLSRFLRAFAKETIKLRNATTTDAYLALLPEKMKLTGADLAHAINVMQIKMQSRFLKVRVNEIETELGLPKGLVEMQTQKREIRKFERTELARAESKYRKRLTPIMNKAKADLAGLEKRIKTAVEKAISDATH